jgi:hypothetical protein
VPLGGDIVAAAKGRKHEEPEHREDTDEVTRLRERDHRVDRLLEGSERRVDSFGSEH